MSGGFGGEWSQLDWENYVARMDAELAHVTPESVANALDGFPLPLQPCMDWTAVATVVRRSLATKVHHPLTDPQRKSKAEARDDLVRLSRLAQRTWVQLKAIDQVSNDRLLEFAAISGWGLPGNRWEGWDTIRRYDAAVAELEWLSEHLLRAAWFPKSTTPDQRGPWRLAELKRASISRGISLATIFEAAFGKKPTANGYRKDGGDARFRVCGATPFMRFYEAMVRLAFPKERVSNLVEITRAACKSHRHQQEGLREWMVLGTSDAEPSDS